MTNPTPAVNHREALRKALEDAATHVKALEASWPEDAYPPICAPRLILHSVESALRVLENVERHAT